MKIEEIKKAVCIAAEEYPITRAILFGSQANATATENSDVDLIMEFSVPVTLITIAKVTQRLEALLNKSVDIIHGPVRDTDLLEIDKEVEVYAA